jgi:hypothetical protein
MIEEHENIDNRMFHKGDLYTMNFSHEHIWSIFIMHKSHQLTFMFAAAVA